jgi:hypothetical protein
MRASCSGCLTCACLHVLQHARATSHLSTACEAMTIACIVARACFRRCWALPLPSLLQRLDCSTSRRRLAAGFAIPPRGPRFRLGRRGPADVHMQAHISMCVGSSNPMRNTGEHWWRCPTRWHTFSSAGGVPPACLKSTRWGDQICLSAVGPSPACWFACPCCARESLIVF